MIDFSGNYEDYLRSKGSTVNFPPSFSGRCIGFTLFTPVTYLFKLPGFTGFAAFLQREILKEERGDFDGWTG